MTAYEVRKKMSEAWKLKKEVMAKQEAMWELRSMAEKITTTFSPTPASPQGNSSRVENYAIRIVEMQGDMAESTEHLIDILREVMELIDMADEPIQRAALTYYHLNGHTAEQTASLIGYSVPQFWRILNEGYVSISENLRRFEIE